MPRVNLKKLQMSAAGACVALVLLVAGYILLIQPPLNDIRADSKLRVQQDRVAQTIGSLRQDFAGRLRKLEESRQLLLSKASWLDRPDLPDEVLSRINELARQCEVRIIGWKPQGQQATSEYHTQIFSLEGAATGPALLRWFALVEEGVPLLDVTHFSVTGPSVPNQNTCEFSCSLKLYLGGQARAMEVAAARP